MSAPIVPPPVGGTSGPKKSNYEWLLDQIADGDDNAFQWILLVFLGALGIIGYVILALLITNFFDGVIGWTTLVLIGIMLMFVKEIAERCRVRSWRPKGTSGKASPKFAKWRTRIIILVALGLIGYAVYTRYADKPNPPGGNGSAAIPGASAGANAPTLSREQTDAAYEVRNSLAGAGVWTLSGEADAIFIDPQSPDRGTVEVVDTTSYDNRIVTLDVMLDSQAPGGNTWRVGCIKDNVLDEIEPGSSAFANIASAENPADRRCPR